MFSPANCSPDVRRGEYISGFVIKVDEVIEGLQILTSLGRRSPMFGNGHHAQAYVHRLFKKQVNGH